MSEFVYLLLNHDLITEKLKIKRLPDLFIRMKNHIWIIYFLEKF